MTTEGAKAKPTFQTEVIGEEIIVTEPAFEFVAIYTKAADRPQLILRRRTATDDYEILAGAWQEANFKARELGWIV